MHADQGSLLERLRNVARSEGTINYGPIAESLDLNMSFDRDRAKIGRILGELSRAEHEEGRPLISAVVVSIDSNMPGKGFFALAKELSLHAGSDDSTFFVQELKRVHDYWASRQG